MTKTQLILKLHELADNEKNKMLRHEDEHIVAYFTGAWLAYKKAEELVLMNADWSDNDEI